jgi:hypothetical protein
MKYLRSFTHLILVAAFALSPALGSAQDMQRGLRNYQEIMAGRMKLEQLSPQQQQEVFLIHRRLEARRQGSNQSPDCQDARNRAQSAAQELADYARRLRSCAESQDFSDDCSSEFRRTKNSHSDYESAVSSVGSYCQ